MIPEYLLSSLIPKPDEFNVATLSTGHRCDIPVHVTRGKAATPNAGRRMDQT